MNLMDQPQTILWKFTPRIWLLLAISFALIGAIFYDGIADMVFKWKREEYSYAYILPLVLIYFIYQKKELLQKIPISGSWIGFFIILLGVFFYFIGELSALYIIIQYSFLITLIGISYLLFGNEGMKILWAPLFLIVFMIPLPSFYQVVISSKLQLLSSEIGVAIIRAFGISVYLEGNVIDLGDMKLQVVEACSGLRYLFPLMALGFIAAYLYKTSVWKRLLVFVSTIPITIFMNSARIGLIGITVDYWGKSAAEGFLHDFEGWAVFMLCTAILILEMWILTKIGKDKKPFSEAFKIDYPVSTATNIINKQQQIPAPLIPAILLLALTLLVPSSLFNTKETILPKRESLTQFPLNIDTWKGKQNIIQPMYVKVLKFTDYIIADYYNENGAAINFYVAYYDSQRAGESAHSPRTCIPGGGWKMQNLTQIDIKTVQVNNKPLRVNRTLVQLGENKQIVYYWFQQRGRIITNEYMVKWYLLWDSLIKRRTDGALVRLTLPLSSEESEKSGDEILQSFAKKIMPLLADYIPN